MATFLLVHGAWHGGWCWDRVAACLQARGHVVLAPTLTGLCERAHLLNPAVDLSTHVDDVVGELLWKDLHGVVLCGHSYAGMVISGVAEREPERIHALVYLDAFLPGDGQSIEDLVAAPTPGDVIAVPPHAALMVNEQDARWVLPRLTPQPGATFRQRLRFTGKRSRIARKYFIRATGTPGPFFDTALERARLDKWTTHEISCRHDAMIDAPDLVENLLTDAAD